MPVRTPAVAGQFYPRSYEECRAAIEECLARAEASPPAGLPAGFKPIAGIAPHAGWICSGAVAGEVIRVLALGGTSPGRPSESGVETFVIFGAAHRRMASPAAVYDQGSWETPLGQAVIDEELARNVMEAAPTVPADIDVHEMEHSIEVEVPFVRYLAPGAKILPIMVSPVMMAVEVGRTVAQAAAKLGRRVVFLGSTDLTHYGPRYQFAPQGVGPEGIRWAKEVNDRQFLGRVLNLQADEVVHEAATHHNACGPGAVAATIAAAQVMGATAAHVLRHTNSNEVLCTRYGQMDDAVGYAGVVLGSASNGNEKLMPGRAVTVQET
ncbi:MAG TPA: AmmeMemoRadiSam system protein B [Phycisphaerae bacterium]|nr:AmmeMemoRadiSam system protein B [Phycisphaerae bacterium]HOJ53481.1 AmmeMemoRadiSam system protein B [Phycisphaerae bacterium]HOL25362.1 AmmeMemoRadiSam system protein B [Phycisphaerae bacterium]HPP21866.1 AmmeMemoRadiSam system protein B [Phycisphaerae bacterium]HPU32156.1 AmmeMemoRadiSam system protein B [Phycisphaerae bacterium]